MKKSNKRRIFLQQGLKFGLATSLMSSYLLACNKKSKTGLPGKESNFSKLNILILGGTSFLGPHQIACALQRGHSVTTFTRGKTRPTVHGALFEQVTQLKGDRESNLKALEKGNWDVVIDNSGHREAWTQKSASLLKDKAHLYVYTSSTGVYYPYLGNDIKEDTKLLLVEPEGIEDQEMKLEYWYGVMKSNSEIAAKRAFGKDRTLVIRPTYMIGPADKSNRFIHWPIRLAQGGEIMIPGKANDPVQYIDVRDVAEWMIRMIEQKKTGTYNAVGPKHYQNMYSFVEQAAGAFTTDKTFIKIDDYNFLKAQHVPYLVPWIMPEGNNKGSALISNEKGIRNGLTYRTLEETIKDTHRWWYSDSITPDLRNAFEQNPETVYFRESDIIKAWKRLIKK